MKLTEYWKWKRKNWWQSSASFQNDYGSVCQNICNNCAKTSGAVGWISQKKLCSYFTTNQKKNKILCRKKIKLSFKYKHNWIHAISLFFDSDHLHLLKPPIITPQTSSMIKNILVLHEICFKKNSMTRTEINKKVINSTTNGNQLILIL